jgi:CheY-like chemotaxis protein
MVILYADDDVDDRTFLAEAFQEIDPAISCITVCDGQEALETLKRSDNLPDYIFLDINMPVMDGRECLVELKKDERLKDIPVVIYSTTTDLFEINYYYSLGASCFVHKPDTFTQLRNVLQNFYRTSTDFRKGNRVK